MKNVNKNDKPFLKLINQYIKDLSFENLIEIEEKEYEKKEKKTSIDISINYNTFKNNFFGVTIKICCNGRLDLKKVNLFHLEMDYFGFFSVTDISNYNSEILTKEGARIIFPFARSIIVNVTQNGGINPIYLDNINFDLLKS